MCIRDRVIKTPGLYVPMAKEIYDPVLRELKEENIVLEESEIDL